MCLPQDRRLAYRWGPPGELEHGAVEHEGEGEETLGGVRPQPRQERGRGPPSALTPSRHHPDPHTPPPRDISFWTLRPTTVGGGKRHSVRACFTQCPCFGHLTGVLSPGLISCSHPLSSLHLGPRAYPPPPQRHGRRWGQRIASAGRGGLGLGARARGGGTSIRGGRRGRGCRGGRGPRGPASAPAVPTPGMARQSEEEEGVMCPFGKSALAVCCGV